MFNILQSIHPSQSQHHQIGSDTKLCPGPAVPPGFACGSQLALRAPPLVAPRVPQPLPRQRPVGSLDRWIVRGKKNKGTNRQHTQNMEISWDLVVFDQNMAFVEDCSRNPSWDCFWTWWEWIAQSLSPSTLDASRMTSFRGAN